MRYRIAAVGRRARDPLIEAADGYLKRLNRYVSSELLLIRDSDRASEAKALLAKTKDSDLVVALDEHGTELDTEAWAHSLSTWQDQGPERVVFLLGGADGHHDTVRERANTLWSLSRLTLPHRLAWVVLLEQLYRAHTVLRGEKYHRV
ncbi:MAG: 23S rRNA (pseudouridine(1915)-N(3))-methyltransferase RlmH [Myxococcota bacterium]